MNPEVLRSVDQKGGPRLNKEEVRQAVRELPQSQLPEIKKLLQGIFDIVDKTDIKQETEH